MPCARPARGRRPASPAPRRTALKAGLFSKLLVISALGETAEELDNFRQQVGADLLPVGAVETELADRVAVLMWRLRRVARHEAAALAPASDALVSHPADVAPAAECRWRPLPPGAPAADRLADVRYAIASGAAGFALYRAAAAALDPAAGPDDLVDEGAVEEVLRAALEPLGWEPDPDPWPVALAAGGFKRRQVHRVQWTPALLARLLGAAAGAVGRDRSAVVDAARARMAEMVAGLERRAEDLRRDEAVLVVELNDERAVAAAARMYADDGLVQRVARAESHLSRELDRTLMMLSRLQGDRPVDAGGSRYGAAGFVLRNGLSAGCPPGLPAPADAG